MKIHKQNLLGLFVGILFLLFSGCNQTPKETTKWFKGNLHTHSYWSDGDDFPEMIMDWYKSNGYHFVVLSDHNILANGEKWKLIPQGFIYLEAFEKYQKKFGQDWVQYEEDTGRIHVKLKTLQEYRPVFEEKDEFLILQGEEITDSYLGAPLHMNVSNIKQLIEPQGGSSVVDVLQNNINELIRQKELLGIPMIIHINHPNFHYAISAEDIMQLEGERFFEVYNGHPAVNNYGDSLHLGTEEMWDLINISYIQNNKPMMYGIATDDSHNYHLFGNEYSNAGRGWIMVRTDSLTSTSLIQAIDAGQFYASTGVVLEDLSLINNMLEIKISAESDVEYEIQFIGVFAGSRDTDILQTVNGTEASFLISGDILFVRAKIISSKLKSNPYQVDEFEIAWTQPYIFENHE